MSENLQNVRTIMILEGENLLMMSEAVFWEYAVPMHPC